MKRAPALLLILCLTGCDRAPKPAAVTVRDPAIMGALSEPLFSDPDLVGASRNATVVAGATLNDGGIPLFGLDDREAQRARLEAEERFQGLVPRAPAPTGKTESSAVAMAATAAAVAAAVPFAARCAPTLSYSFSWAAELPEAVPVYPRAHVQEAGGSDEQGCGLRVINFQTPVTVRDVLDFYHASAARINLPATVSAEGDDLVVSARGKGLSFSVHARRMADGVTEVDLVING